MNTPGVILNTSMNTAMNSSIMSEEMSEPSSPESHDYDDSDLLHSAVTDDVTAQLAHAGMLSVYIIKIVKLLL